MTTNWIGWHLDRLFVSVAMIGRIRPLEWIVGLELYESIAASGIAIRSFGKGENIGIFASILMHVHVQSQAHLA